MSGRVRGAASDPSALSLQETRKLHSRETGSSLWAASILTNQNLPRTETKISTEVAVKKDSHPHGFKAARRAMKTSPLFPEPCRGAPPKGSPGRSGRAKSEQAQSWVRRPPLMSLKGRFSGSQKAETRLRLHGNRPESGWTKLPDRSVLRTELGWQERPFRT